MEVFYVLDTSFIAHIEDCFRNFLERELIFNYLTDEQAKKAYALLPEITKSLCNRSWLNPYLEDIETPDEKIIEFLYLQSKSDSDLIIRQITPNDFNDIKLIHFAYMRQGSHTIVSDDKKMLVLANHFSIKRSCFKEIIRKIHTAYGTNFNHHELNCSFMFSAESSSPFWQSYSNIKKCQTCHPGKECISYSNPPKDREGMPKETQ